MAFISSFVSPPLPLSFLSSPFIHFLICIVIANPSSAFRPYLEFPSHLCKHSDSFSSFGLLFINRPSCQPHALSPFPQLFLFPFLFFCPPPSHPFTRQAHDPPLPMTHSPLCALATQSTKKACRGCPLSLRSVQQANWGYYKARNATTSETVAGAAAGDPPHRLSHLHIIMFFTGTGKGVVREGEWCVGWQKEGIKGTWEVGEAVEKVVVDEIGVTVEKWCWWRTVGMRRRWSADRFIAGSERNILKGQQKERH